jgi:GNAT superfamily N-acetyltransferase
LTVQMFRYSMPPLLIRPARRDEAPLLHELTQRSVMAWGYEPAFLEWEPEAIAVTPAFLDGATAFVLEQDDRIAGYHALVEKDATVYLDKLFVEPDWIGSGCGRRLWEHAVDTARGMGYDEMMLDADPNAAPFYRAMGAEWLRESETSWPGWKLQVFRYRLPDAVAG